MNQSYEKFITFIFILLIFFIISNLILSFYNINRLHDEDYWLMHADKVKIELKNVYIDILEAESSVRGYTITGDNNFIQRYKKTVPSLNGHITKLKNLTSDNPTQQKNISVLKNEIDGRVGYLDQLIKTRQAEGNTFTMPLSIVGKGRATMDKISQMIDTMNFQEDNLLIMREQATIKSYSILYITTLVADILDLLFIVFIFITVRNELERREALERNKDQFIALASHELKTPVTSLKVYTQLLGQEAKKVNYKMGSQLLPKMEVQINKLTNLVNDFLDLSRIQTGKLKYRQEWFSINNLVKDVTESIQQVYHEYKIIIKGTTRKKIYADKERISQVIINLLTNAVKYSPNKKRIIVRLKDMKNAVQVSVQDFGMGIPKKEQVKIFDRFYQAKRKDKNTMTYPGLGIGLFISREIVKKHNGTLRVDSIERKGTTFSLTLPVHPSFGK